MLGTIKLTVNNCTKILTSRIYTSSASLKYLNSQDTKIIWDISVAVRNVYSEGTFSNNDYHAQS